MVRLLREVLMQVKAEGVVRTALDRIEQCNCKTNHLMDELAKLVAEGSFSVKNAAIIKGDELDASNLDEKPLAQLMERIGWRQEWVEQRRRSAARVGESEAAL
jgi:hypothetical protein